MPDGYAAQIEGMDKEAQMVLRNFNVPCWIRIQLKNDGHTSLLDLADRWRTKDECRDNSHTDYAFADTQSHFDVRTSLRARIRLAQAVEDAKKSV